MNRKLRISSLISAAVLAFTIAAIPAASVSATESQTGTVTADVLNVRSAPGTANSKIGYITYGQTVEVVAHTDGWYQINYNGKTGYVAEGYLSVSGEVTGSTAVNKAATVDATSLNVRSGPGTNYQIIGSLKNGASVAVTSSSGDWYQVSYSGKTGYVSGEFLVFGEEETPSAPSTGDKTGVVTADVLNVRTGPSTGNSKVGVIYSGKQLTILSESNGWYQVSYDGKTGYVSAEFVEIKSSGSTVTPPSNDAVVSNKTGTVNANSLNVREGAGTSYKKIDSLFAGKSVTITTTLNGWYQISYDGKSGYVSAEYVDVDDDTTTTPNEPETPSTPTEEKAGIVNVASLNVRSGPDTSYDKQGLIYSGKKVTVTGTSGEWYQISYDGKTGYVFAEYITISDGTTADPGNSAQVESLLNAARGEIGYQADEGSVTKYGSWYGLPRTAWCAMFVSWCADQAGIPTSIVPKHASCFSGVDWFKQNGTWHDRDGYQPKPGDIIYFTVSHVGIVESVSDSKVTTIEGNTTNSVRRRTYALNYSTILGYGSPNYTN